MLETDKKNGDQDALPGGMMTFLARRCCGYTEMIAQPSLKKKLNRKWSPGNSQYKLIAELLGVDNSRSKILSSSFDLFDLPEEHMLRSIAEMTRRMRGVLLASFVAEPR